VGDTLIVMVRTGLPHFACHYKIPLAQKVPGQPRGWAGATQLWGVNNVRM
jgi:hypothetical protein